MAKIYWDLISLTGNEQQAKSIAHELKLCGVWEHCADLPTFVLWLLLMVLN